LSGWGPRRRFWRTARIRPEAGGYAVDLDDRALATPAGSPLVLPTEALARAVAAEWDALGGEIDPALLPLTRAANSAIDRVAVQRDAVIDAIAEYGGSDLLCYRAEAPAALAARQAAGWDPWLAWGARTFGAPLVAVAGVIHQPQPAASLAALRRAVAEHDAFGLAALHELVSLCGSLVLGLAVARGALDAATAWELSRIDEAWQEEHWGLDAEAEAASERRREAFVRAAAMLSLLGQATRGPLIH
jgi:chaperone required for assembly of F1-ATPase